MSTEDFKQMVTPCDDPFPVGPDTQPEPAPSAADNAPTSLAATIISDIDKIEAAKRMRKDAEAQPTPAPTPELPWFWAETMELPCGDGPCKTLKCVSLEDAQAALAAKDREIERLEAEVQTADNRAGRYYSKQIAELRARLVAALQGTGDAT